MPRKRKAPRRRSSQDREKNLSARALWLGLIAVMIVGGLTGYGLVQAGTPGWLAFLGLIGAVFVTLGVVSLFAPRTARGLFALVLDVLVNVAVLRP